jgi:hypothetical protein
MYIFEELLILENLSSVILSAHVFRGSRLGASNDAPTRPWIVYA